MTDDDRPNDADRWESEYEAWAKELEEAEMINRLLEDAREQ